MTLTCCPYMIIAKGNQGGIMINKCTTTIESIFVASNQALLLTQIVSYTCKEEGKPGSLLVHI